MVPVEITRSGTTYGYAVTTLEIGKKSSKIVSYTELANCQFTFQAISGITIESYTMGSSNGGWSIGRR